ncbi:MAG: hypothetical protein IKC97_07725 [Clostridia bacterium]|nr:hypothetical protein [Clostridia bacterium]
MKPEKTNRFICTEISGGAFAATQQRVLVDRKTGVNYLWTSAGYAGGLTVLVDAEGRPIVTPVPRDEE